MKKISIVALSSLLLLLSGCTPEGIIPSDDMVAILSDFYLADACMEADPDSQGLFENYRIYEPVLDKHGYTKTAFIGSVDWYLHHPDKFQKIFKRTEAALKALDASPGADRMDMEDQDMLARPVPAEGSEPLIEMPESEEGSGVQQQAPVKKSRKKMSKKELKRLEKELKSNKQEEEQ